MKNRNVLFLLFLLLSFSISLRAQEEEEEFDLESRSPPPTLTLGDLEEEEEEDKEEEPKKRKRNVFYDIKTKKYFIKKGYGNNVVLELFHYPKKPIEPVPYVRDIYWYDFQRKQIRIGRNIDEENGVILHGPYRKIRAEDEAILEEGIFYHGAKHGRWTSYSRNDILLDKEKYIRGWPKESRVAYHDFERSKLKEILPVEHGEKEGTYYKFFEDGHVAVKGDYRYDRKVGIWTEYYHHRRSRKREIQYRKDPYNETFQPYIRREWDDRGRLIYQSPKID